MRVSDIFRDFSLYYMGLHLIFVSLMMLDVIHLSFEERAHCPAGGGTVRPRRPRFPPRGHFALPLFPSSAILFFGMLIPLVVSTTEGGLYLTVLYAVGTSLPVLVVALAIAFGAGA